MPILRGQGLATDHPVTVARAADGTIVEVFEWKPGGIEKAHTNPEVLKLWGRYAEACDYVPLNTLSETSQSFASFAPVTPVGHGGSQIP